MSDQVLIALLIIAVGLPSLAASLVGRFDERRARRLALVVALTTLGVVIGAACSLLGQASLAYRALSLPIPSLAGAGALFGYDPLAASLSVVICISTVVVLVGTPRVHSDRVGLRSLLYGSSAALAVVTLHQIHLFAVAWSLSLWLTHAHLRRAAAAGQPQPHNGVLIAALVSASAPLLVVVAEMSVSGGGGGAGSGAWASLLGGEGWLGRTGGAAGLLCVAALARLALPPLHGVTVGRFNVRHIGAASASWQHQPGLYLLLRAGLLALPSGDPVALTLAWVAVISAIALALVGLAKRDARQWLPYFVTSQTAMMLVGACTHRSEGSVGALCAIVSLGLAATGMRCALQQLDARLGEHGSRDVLVARALPQLTLSYVLLGLVAVGIPGGLGFIAEDLLLNSVVEAWPLIGAGLLLATAINAIAFLRGVAATFLASGSQQAPTPDLLPRERATSWTLVALLVVSGLWPSAQVSWHDAAARSLRRGANTRQRRSARAAIDRPAAQRGLNTKESKLP